MKKRFPNAPSPGPDSPVPDRWLLWGGYPLLALALVHIGNDNTFRKLLTIPSYYSDLALAFGLVYATGWYLRRVHQYADRRFSWYGSLRSRLAWITLYGLALPLAIGICIEVLYLVFLLDISVRKSTVFYLELPVAGMGLAVINLLYLLLYYRRFHTGLLAAGHTQPASTPDVAGVRAAPSFLAYKGANAIRIPAENVGYFLVRNRQTWLITLAEEEYLLNEPLEKILPQLDPGLFFQLNRQVVAHLPAVTGFSHTETRKLTVRLEPDPGEEVFVSKEKAGRFIKWIKGTEA